MTAMFRPPIAVASAIGWRQVFGIDASSDPFWGQVRAQQISVVSRYVPFNVACMAVNMGAALWLLRDAGEGGFLIAWGTTLSALCLMWVLTARARARSPQSAVGATSRELWTVSAKVVAFAVCWSALILHTLGIASAATQIYLVLMSLALMGVCGFATATMPVGAIVTVTVIAAATVAAIPTGSPFESWPVYLCFATFTVVIVRGIIATTVAVMARLRTQTDNAEATAVIGLLLNEFEAHGSDWLIEVDTQGCLTHVSSRLCEVAGRPREALIDAPLVGLLGPDRRDLAVRGAARTLTRHFTRRDAFRDLVVPVAVRSELRWWSLTGTPKHDAVGNFTGFRGVGSDVTAARHASDRIADLAHFDPLTGLANRAIVSSTIVEALAASTCGHGECGLLFIDLDRFKQVNDMLGHHAGDLLLREVAVRLRDVVGSGPLVGRLGGDEFAVVISPCTARRAERIAKQVVNALSRPFVIEGKTVSIGASVGFAIGPGDGAGVDALLRAADLALYEVKGSGSGAACRFTPEIQARAEERRSLEVDLAHALDRGELSLVFQPIVEAADERIVGFEALLRWTHPRLGQIPPVKFIPVAEDTGLICRIGDWVIQEACKWAARWPHDIRIAVNLSALQFDDVNLPRTIRNALIASNIAPDRLELEITESVFLNDRPATAAMIARLRALGIRFALDDFGTGYSSLGYLRKADFSRIKIDRSFVQRAAIDEGESTAIIKAIVSLASSLGMSTTAEGTETRAEFEACRSLGCGQVQGYLFGRPMPPEDATALVTYKVAA